MRHNIVLAGLVAAALGGASTPVAGQETCTVEVSPSTVEVDEVFYVSGTGFAPESFLTLTISEPDGTVDALPLEELGQDIHRTDAEGAFGPLDIVIGPDPGQASAELVGTLGIGLNDDSCTASIEVPMVDSFAADPDPQALAAAYHAVLEEYTAKSVVQPLAFALGEAGDDTTKLATAYSDWATWADDFVAAVEVIDLPAEVGPQFFNFIGTYREFAGIHRALAEEPFSDSLRAERFEVMATLDNVVSALSEELGPVPQVADSAPSD